MKKIEISVSRKIVTTICGYKKGTDDSIITKTNKSLWLNTWIQLILRFRILFLAIFYHSDFITNDSWNWIYIRSTHVYINTYQCTNPRFSWLTEMKYYTDLYRKCKTKIKNSAQDCGHFVHKFTSSGPHCIHFPYFWHSSGPKLFPG